MRVSGNNYAPTQGESHNEKISIGSAQTIMLNGKCCSINFKEMKFSKCKELTREMMGGFEFFSSIKNFLVSFVIFLFGNAGFNSIASAFNPKALTSDGSTPNSDADVPELSEYADLKVNQNTQSTNFEVQSLFPAIRTTLAKYQPVHPQFCSYYCTYRKMEDNNPDMASSAVVKRPEFIIKKSGKVEGFGPDQYAKKDGIYTTCQANERSFSRIAVIDDYAYNIECDEQGNTRQYSSDTSPKTFFIKLTPIGDGGKILYREISAD
ncbi:MAG: hypothetical protein LBI69_03855 [Puniceicoccales bacterium]|jgi:hypothetical protein|nr:hypothetical protein [Puniceicoccales bacterium]